MPDTRADDEVPEKKLKLDTFTTQTNALDVDKHMMAYIEQEMRKRRGELTKEEEDAIAQARRKGPLDMYEELYKIPDRLKVKLCLVRIRGTIDLLSVSF